MEQCYLCGKEFNENDVKKHDEHIIQQAIGGTLTANDILCSKCGGKLGKEIDKPFNEIFSGISTRLDIKKDRNNNRKSSVKGTFVNLKYKLQELTFITESKFKYKINDYKDFIYQYNEFCNPIKEMEVIWQNFKIYPLKPFYRYINNRVEIYGQKKNIKTFRKKIEKEIKEQYGQNVNIYECDDLTGLVEFPFEMNDKIFKRGLAKIAIGFASSLGVKRTEIPLLLDTKENKIKDKINSLPFYPFGLFDKLIELQKNKFEHYPFHNLVLFTLPYPPEVSDKKILICYIELFSTFQWYIILNDNYSGKSIPYKYYVQEILKKDDYKVEINWRRYYKERNLYLDPLNITEEDIERKYSSYKRKLFSKFKWSTSSDISRLKEKYDFSKNIKDRWSIEADLIQEETNKQRYRFDFEEYVNSIIKTIINQSLINKSKDSFKNIKYDSNHIASFIGNKTIELEYDKVWDNIDSMINFKKNMDLFFKQKYNDFDEEFIINSYRIAFYKKEQLLFYPLLKADYKDLKKYKHMKFYMLEDFIQEENFKRKFLNDK